MAATDVFYHHRIPSPEQMIVIEGKEGHHAQKVRRITTGDSLCITNGEGELARCVVTGTESGRLELQCIEKLQVPPVSPRLTVVQAIVKGDRADSVFDDLTQAGADRIIPWQADRSIRNIEEKVQKVHNRWLNIAMSAAKQSRRAWFPEVERPMTTALLALELKEMLDERSLIIVLDENAQKSLPDFFASHPVNTYQEICIVIGPEGGITEKELTTFERLQGHQVTMGPQVIRSWLAGTIALSYISGATDRWSALPIH